MYNTQAEKILCTATFLGVKPAKELPKEKRKIALIVYYILAVLVFFTSISEGTYGTYVWYGIRVVNRYGSINVDELILMFLIMAAVAVFPFVFTSLIKLLTGMGKARKELYLTESAVCGVVRTFLLDKEVRIPLDKISTVSLIRRFFDKVKGVKSVCIFSGSGNLRFGGIKNGDEFVKAVFAQIEKRNNGGCECESAEKTAEE